ncbi:MAG: hypothetical protein IT267_04790 [Saprospiraceae bacterium]|nr:hypothetical protein [Saprospiraceae bacterium]
MLLNIVTDEELLVSQIVKTILFFFLIAGIVFNIIKLVRTQSKTIRIVSCTILAILSIVLFFVVSAYQIEASLLKNPEYVIGVTIGTCNVFARGEGIEFEYEVNGQKYRNCNTYYPILIDSIEIKGGKYSVRYSAKYPDKGRMVFNKD